jgi:hypothetical protein
MKDLAAIEQKFIVPEEPLALRAPEKKTLQEIE